MTHPLSPKQAEVMGCVARGMRNKQIAHELGMGVSTVKSHVRASLVKLEVHTRVQAAVLLQVTDKPHQKWEGQMAIVDVPKCVLIKSDGTGNRTQLFDETGHEIRGMITNIEWSIEPEKFGTATVTFENVAVEAVGALVERHAEEG